MQSEFNSFIKEIDSRLQPEKSFDIVKRELLFANRAAVLYFTDGFIKDEVFEKVLEFLFKQTDEELDKIQDMKRFSKNKMPYVEVDYTYEPQTAVTNVLSGPAVLVIEGIRGALLIDTRTYPTRSIEEPQKDKSLRGSRDGFVETLIFNTSMIRRRIRCEKLRMEYYQIGKNSKVDVAIGFIEGVADEKVIGLLRKRIKEMGVKGISMTQEAISEALLPHRFYSIFPKFKFTERPDYASACILDGKIVLIMDNSPAVMILPTSFSDFFRDTDDYYFMPVVASYTRILRLVVSLFTVIAAPLYLLMTNEPQYMPGWLGFMKASADAAVPLFAQFLILELIVDGLELASLNTPDTLSNSLGIIGGLLLSEFAINAGWFVTEAILFMAFVTIAGFAQPSYEMGYAMKFERLMLLILVQLFGLWGFIGGLVLCMALMLCNKTLTGYDYLYPIFPFNGKAFLKLFVRPRISKNH